MRIRTTALALVLTIAGSVAACESSSSRTSSDQSVSPVNSEAAQAPEDCTSGAGFDADINHFPLTPWPENSFADPCWPR